MTEQTVQDQLEEMSAMSLMDLGSIDTSGIEARTSRLQDKGIYVLDVQEAGFVEQPAKDPADPMNFNLIVKSNILAYLPDPDITTPRDLENKIFTDRIFMWGKELGESIAYLKGRYKQADLPYDSARMGGIEGQEPGWVDGVVGQRIIVRVTHSGEKAYVNWLSAKQVEKIEGLEWADIIGRESLAPEKAA